MCGGYIYIFQFCDIMTNCSLSFFFVVVIITYIVLPGIVPRCCYWQCVHVRGRPGQQHPLGNQLPNLSLEEELAECEGSLYKEHHGESLPALLTVTFNNNMY